MKILRLAFENINNLKGKHTLDFTELPLADAPIFAITGPTGSGKSTLLDVITLALFNRTPRFKRISKKELGETGSIITRNQTQAKAQIDYEIDGCGYISKWEIKYNRNNKLNDYHMEIIANGSVLDLHRRDVPKKNEELIGLDYDQFTKAIILSQGEFSKFLKADSNERSVLLERITGTSIYRDLGVKSHEVFRDKKNELLVITQQLDAFQLLSDQEVKVLNEQILRYQQELTVITENLVIYDKKLAKRKEYDALVKDVDKYTLALSENKKATQDFTGDLKRLALHKQVAPYGKDIEDFKKKETLIVHSKAQIEYHTKRFKEALKLKVSLFQGLSNLLGQKVTEDTYIEQINTFKEQYVKLQSDMVYIIETGEKLKSEVDIVVHSSYIKGYKFTSKTDIEIVDNALSEITAILKDSSYDANTVIEDVEEDKLRVEHDLHDYKELKKYLQFKKQFGLKITEIQNEIIALKKQLEILPKEIALGQEELRYLALHIKKISLEIQIAGFDEHRTALIQGKPCPLCGSLKHPYNENNLQIEQGLNQQLEKFKQQELRLQEKLAKLNSTLAYTKVTITDKEKNSATIEKEILSSATQTKQHLHKSNLFESLPDLNLERLITKSEQDKLRLTNLIQELKKITPLKRLSDLINELLKLREAYQKLHRKAKQLYSGEDLVKDLTDFDQQLKENSKVLLLSENTVANEEQTLKEHLKAFELLTEVIEKVKTVTNIISLQDLHDSILDDQQLDKITVQQKQLETTNTELKALLDQATMRLQKMPVTEILEVDTAMLISKRDEGNKRKETLIGLKVKNEEQLKANSKMLLKQQELYKVYDMLLKEFSRWEALKQLIGGSTGKEFSTFAQELTLQQLIAYTNKRLKSFSGRYLIYSDKQSKELMIIDCIQGNAERSVKTLSGGEIFLVSLAMALSLSDMASKNVKLESLFIDEGFGTLDDETLEHAVELLEKLQQESAKTVGVISHVKELKERILVQVQLQKNSQGFSRLNVVQI